MCCLPIDQTGYGKNQNPQFQIIEGMVQGVSFDSEDGNHFIIISNGHVCKKKIEETGVDILTVFFDKYHNHKVFGVICPNCGHLNWFFEKPTYQCVCSDNNRCYVRSVIKDCVSGW